MATRPSCASPTCRAPRSRSSSTSQRYKGRVPVEMLGRTAFPPIGDLPYLLTLPRARLLLVPAGERREPPAWHEEMLVREELPMLVLFDGWISFFRDQVVPWRIGMAEKLRARAGGRGACRGTSRRSAGTPRRAAGQAGAHGGLRHLAGRPRRLARHAAGGWRRDTTSCRSRSRWEDEEEQCVRSPRAPSPACASRRTSASSATRWPTRRSAATWSRRSASSRSAADRERQAAVRADRRLRHARQRRISPRSASARSRRRAPTPRCSSASACSSSAIGACARASIPSSKSAAS